MKKLYSFIATIMIITVVKSQPGSNCSNAINLAPANNLTYQSHTSSGKEYWVKFTAQTEYANISVKTKPYGNNSEHTHESTLYKGTCGNLTEIKKDELPFVNYAEELSIDMNASGLVPGNTYYLKIDREAHTLPCDKSNCTANNSSNPALFDIAIQNISILVPIDFAAEKPPVAFHYEQNRGQLLKTDGTYAPEIKLYNDKMNPALYLGEDKASFVWSKIDNDSLTLDSLHRVDMMLVGSNPKPQIFRTENIETQTNYYLSHTAKGVHNKENYGRIVAKEVYNKIDMQLSSNDLGAKIFFTVQPGGNADDIVMQFDGATAVNVTTDSSKLEIITPLGTLDFEAGHAYQINQGNQIVPMPWQAKYISLGGNKVKLDIRNYPQNMPLFIQVDRGHIAPPPAAPANNEWVTLFGKNEAVGFDIAADESDNVYVTGYTTSASFPVLNAFQGELAGEQDIFIGKFKDAVPLWVTYYGGEYNDVGYSVDAWGNDVYIAGRSGSLTIPVFPPNHPTDSTHWQNFNPGNFTIGVIIRLDILNGFPKWATFFGGAQTPTQVYGLAIAKTGISNVFITGTTRGNQFPLKQSPFSDAYYQTTYNGMGSNNFASFITCFNPDNKLTWSTFFGSDNETGWDIAVKNDDVYIAGTTSAYNGSILSPSCIALNDSQFPLCNSNNNSYIQQFSSNANENSFIARFSQSGQLKWSTLFGSNAQDIGTGIALNSKGDVYMAGYTWSSAGSDVPCTVPSNGGFPLCNPLQDSSYASLFVNADIFISKFNSDNQLSFSTFYGGVSDEWGLEFPAYDNYLSTRVATDDRDNVFVTGLTKDKGAPGFPTLSYPSFYYQDAALAYDVFLLGLNSSDQLLWATLYGGSFNDRGAGIATYKGEHLYINGRTDGFDFLTVCPPPTPTGTPYCVAPMGSTGTYSFIGRFDISSLPVSVNSSLKEKQKLLVYPNPANDNLYISGFSGKAEKINIRLFNSIGQQIMQKTIQPKEQEIYSLPLSGITAGIYLLQIESGIGLVSKKIIKTAE